MHHPSSNTRCTSSALCYGMRVRATPCSRISCSRSSSPLGSCATISKVKVISAYPLQKVLCSPNTVGRIAEWNIELQAFQLEFSTTRVIKGAALADFVAEWTDAPDQGAAEDRSLAPGDETPDGWVVYFDGAFSCLGAGAGAVLVSPTQDKLRYAVQLCF